MMTRLNIAPDQYTIVDRPSDLTMFISGDVPVWGVFLNSFLITIEQAGYQVNLVYPDDYGVHFYSDTLYTTDDLITTNLDLVQRFVRATLKGWTYVVENPSEAPASVTKYKPDVDVENEYKRTIASLPLVNTGEDQNGWMKPEVWADMAQTLRDQGLLTQHLNITQLYTMQFLETIYK